MTMAGVHHIVLSLCAAALSATTTRASEIRVVSTATMTQNQTFGRVRVFLTAGTCDATAAEPRALCDDSQSTSQVFGVDAPEGFFAAAAAASSSEESTPSVNGENTPTSNLRKTRSSAPVAIVNETTLGYPALSLSDLAPGAYCAQADLAPYVKYVRPNETLLLPTSCVSDGGNDGSYGAPPGALYSKPTDVVLSQSEDASLELTLDSEEPVPESPGCSGYGADTEYVKTVSVDSKRLEEFWGAPMKLEACVLLPFGFDDHPDARYPLVIAHGHYSAVFAPGGRFDPTPPSENLTGYDYVDQLYANYLYNNWTSSDPSSPFYKARMLVATINHPVPFFDDSYAVDSVNVGPYGAAILEDLIPEIERLYRGIGAGWARGVFGGSTGGWISLATQVLYPDDYNAAAVACPDPIAFTSYATVNVYDSKNGYYYDSDFKKTPRPGARDAYSGTTVIPGTTTPTFGIPRGDTQATIEEMNRRENVLGPLGGSCGQWNIWEAVFSPKGPDGLPAPIWCKGDRTDDACEYGAIDPDVAAYWQENFDLLYRLQRDWTSAGLNAKLDFGAKLQIFVGGSDTFFLDNAVMDLQDWAENTPDFVGNITIGTHDGRGYEHCFNGYLPDGTVAPNAVTRELYLQKFLPWMATRFEASAPQDGNLEWRTY